MRIRPAVIDDVQRVLPMVRAICDLHERHDPQRFRVRADVLERYAAWLPQRIADSRSVFLIAEDPTSATAPLAAYVVCTVEPEVPVFWVPECAWVHDIWVEPASRGHGLARSMVREVIRKYEAMGIGQVRLHTGTFNDEARALFAAEGFRPSVIEMLRPLEPPSATA